LPSLGWKKHPPTASYQEQLSDNNLPSGIKGKCFRLPMRGEKENHRKATNKGLFATKA